jgi:hypothetical protein
VLVLCDLEGHTREEAARKLGASAGTVATWLARGRKKLRERLVKRGVSAGVAGIGAILSQSSAASQQVSVELVDQTVRHVELFFAGKSTAALPAAERIGSLAQGVLQAMFLSKLSTTVCILALALVLGASPVSTMLGLTSDARAQEFMPFLDDFEDLSATDGSPATWVQGGTNGVSQVIAGDYVLSGVQTSFFPVDVGVFRDGSVRAQLRFLQSNSSTAAYVFARSPTAAGYLGAIRQDGALVIVEAFDSLPIEVLGETVGTSLNPMARDVVLQLDTAGNRISLTAWHDGDAMPSQPQVVVFDDSLTFGDVGVGISPDPRVGPGAHSQVAFRYFEAIPEPSTVALGSLGFVALAAFGVRTRLNRVRRLL